MRVHRGGFTLIELVIAISIAGVMSVILFRSLFQINTSTILSDRVMSFDEKAERLIQLFDHDLAGATTLVDNEPPKEPTDMKQTSTAGGQQQQQPQKKDVPEKKPKKIIKKLFNSTNEGERLDTLTFISNNPMASYWISTHGTESAGKPKPNLVRITYTLKEDPENKGSFILKRQESVQLDWEKKSGKIYDVMTGIKNISVEYTQKIEKIVKIEELKKDDVDKNKSKQAQPQQPGQQPATKDPKPPSKGPQTKTEVEYKTMKTWDIDQKEEEKKKEEEEKAKKEKEQIKKKPIPVLAKITAALFDNTMQRTVEFVFIVPIISDTEFTPKRRRGMQMQRFPMPSPTSPGQPGAGQQPGSQGQQQAYRTPPFNARLYS